MTVAQRGAVRALSAHAHTLAAFGAGLLFAIGLGVGGMTDANKVIGFLDLAGGWDPSLAFVMVGAIAAHALLNRWILRRNRPMFGTRFALPTRRDIDLRLVAGAAVFGMGWGLGGFCPGPGLVSVAGLGADALVFVAAMLAGMGAFELARTPAGQPASTHEAPC